MLKIIENKEEAMDLIQQLSEHEELENFDIGLGGSFVVDLNKKNSPIDIILRVKDKVDMKLVGAVEYVDFIQRYMSNIYSNKFQVVWLDLLERDEISLIEFMKDMGLEANPESAYTNIVENVKWADSDASDDDLSAKVMTWNEDEDTKEDDE